MDLFDAQERDIPAEAEPLAARMRPRTLDEFQGQRHILGEGRLLSRAIVGPDRFADPLGAAGVGEDDARRGDRPGDPQPLRAHQRGDGQRRDPAQGDLRRAEPPSGEGEKTTLFIDEIHRFNKAQQDVLLPHVERGGIALIGATTHNPCFYVNAPLLSRSLLFELKPLEKEDLRAIVARALADRERGLGAMRVAVDDDALEHLLNACEGTRGAP